MGPLIPFFRLLVMSVLGFKARQGSLICTWQRCTCYTFRGIYLWCNTCWPLDGQHGNRAVLIHVLASIIVVFPFIRPRLLPGLYTLHCRNSFHEPTFLQWVQLLEHHRANIYDSFTTRRLTSLLTLLSCCEKQSVNKTEMFYSAPWIDGMVTLNNFVSKLLTVSS